MKENHPTERKVTIGTGNRREEDQVTFPNGRKVLPEKVVILEAVSNEIPVLTVVNSGEKVIMITLKKRDDILLEIGSATQL